ncbi:hypothetical protein OQA88_2229 [Cercophora sp. LCS_1]
MKSTLLAVAAFAATLVSAHGNITWPPARLPGPAMLAACGQAAVNTVLGDGTIALEEVKPASSACNVGLCRGAMFEDNTDKVQTFSLGQVVVIEVALTIPHEGPANVSIVQTSTNKIVGGILLFFDTYADEKLAEMPANNTAFGVTLPTGEAGKEVQAACKQAGDCVLQWWWLGTDAKQTYESCVDFVLAPAPAGGPNVGANSRNRVVGGQAGNGNGTVAGTPPTPSQGATNGAVVEAAPVVEVVAAPAKEGSFGGVQGVVAVDGGETTPQADGSFGGVAGTIPVAVRRSRVARLSA